MVGEIERALDAAPPGLAALVIEGAKAASSAPAPISNRCRRRWRRRPRPARPIRLQALNAAGGRFFARFAALPFVTIAVVDGAAVGGGMGLAAAADIVVRDRSARASRSPRRASAFRRRRSRPISSPASASAVARRLALTGARLDGREAAALGLADFYLRQRRRTRRKDRGAACKPIERCAPGANAETKRLFRACRARAARRLYRDGGEELRRGPARRRGARGARGFRRRSARRMGEEGA